MKRFLAAGCLTVVALTAVAITKADDFKGPYVGISVNDAISSGNAQTTTVFLDNGYFASSSVTAIASTGAQQISSCCFAPSGGVGYNLQLGNIIVGGEADFSLLGINSSSTSGTTTYPCCAGTSFTIVQQVLPNWLLTARPRVGYVWGNLMVYGSLGLAETHVRYQELFTDTLAGATETGALKQNMTGWTIGGGAEYKMGPHLSVKAEYLYAGFGTITTTSTNLTALTPPIAFPQNVFTNSLDFHVQIVRAGFNWRF